MFNPKNKGTEFNFWPSIADTLLAIFMVFLMLWLAEKIIFLQELNHVKTGNEALTQKFAKSEEHLEVAKKTIDKIEQSANGVMLGWQRCEGEKRACESDLENCKQQKRKIHVDASQTRRKLWNLLQECKSDKARYLRDKPPIINLPETLGFSFNTGQALLSSEFETLLKYNVVPKLKEIKDKHNVNVIEVIGHTDGVMAGGNSNLDDQLENAVAQGDISSLRYGSNADLGLMRALAVAFFLRKQPELSGVKFRVYSAAQLILSDGELANNSDRYPNEDRRRIELRFTNLGTE